MRTKVWFENLKGRGNLGNPYANARIILKLILNNYGVSAGTGFIWLMIDSSGGFLGGR
jgi:hypothetical protein